MLISKRIGIILCTMLIFGSAEIFASSQLRFEGRAVSVETGELYYTESHQVILNESGDYLSALVVYKTPEGEVFAEKTLDYVKNQQAPDMMFHDKRTGERVTVNVDQPGKTLRVLYEQNDARREKKVDMEADALVVVDAGFSRFIELSWSALNKGKTQPFYFLAISRGQLFNFEAMPVSQTDSVLKVELHPNNFLIKFLVEPIQLTYDQASKRLLRFEGLTNIERFEAGKRSYSNYVARIDYVYEPVKPYAL